MQIYFDNIFGHQTHGDLLFSVVSAEFNKNEYNYAFENGWSPIGIWYNRKNDIVWYQSRQTRVDLHNHFNNDFLKMEIDTRMKTLRFFKGFELLGTY